MSQDRCVHEASARTVATYIATVDAWGITILGGVATLVLTAPACGRSLDWWATGASSDALMIMVVTAVFGVLLSGSVVEVARRASRGSWWCIPLLLTLSIGLGAATWFLPLSALNGYLQDDMIPACTTATPRFFINFIVFGFWVALFSPILLLLVWTIGRTRRSGTRT